MGSGLMHIEDTAIRGVRVIYDTPHHDARGTFVETYYPAIALEFGPVYQISHSINKKYVLRGLHLQISPPMSKIVRVISGKAVLVNVDVNPESSTYGQSISTILDQTDHIAILGTPLIARGFFSLEDNTIIQYTHSALYNHHFAYTIAFDDPNINAEWGIPDGVTPLTSSKDLDGMTLCQWEDVFAQFKEKYPSKTT